MMTVPPGQAKKVNETLPTPTMVVVSPAEQVTLNDIVIRHIHDNPNLKRITVSIEGYPGRILLWSGAEYDNVGDWTYQDIIDRIKVVLGI